MKKVLIFSPYALSTSHHEFALEMAKEHLEFGHKVYVVLCDRTLKTCDQNPNHKFITCLTCSSTARNSFKKIGVPSENFLKLNLSPPSKNLQVESFESMEALQNFKWNGFPAGRAVASSIITGQCRDTNPDMKKYASYARNCFAMYAAVLDFFIKTFRETHYDLFYTFNGRSTIYSAAFEAAQYCKVYCRTGERDFEGQYVILENANCLDLKYMKQTLINLESQMKADPNGEKIAHEWFIKSKNGAGDFLFNYLNAQRKNALPDGFDRKKRNVAIFCSSEDEMVIEPTFKCRLFSTQNEGIQYIVQNLKDKNCHIYLRVHPNLKGIDCAQTRDLKLIRGDNFTIIPPESSVDTYALMEASDTIVTFGSTTSIEAVYLNKPVILLGRNVFEDMGVFYIPQSSAELIQLLSSVLSPFDSKKALPYGYWRAMRGHLFKYIKFQDPHVGNVTLFNGTPILIPGIIVKSILRIYYRLNGLLGRLLLKQKRA